MNNPLFWIGIRESEIDSTNMLFTGSITIFGSGENGNYSFERENHIRFDYNQDYPEWNQFVKDLAHKIVAEYPDCLFMLYDPIDIREYGLEVAQHAICQNPESLIELLDNKFQTRQWLSSCVPILPYQMLLGSSINYNRLIRTFPAENKFVVQASSSCGGNGTFLLTKENHMQICNHLLSDSVYAISPYKGNSISPNVHLIIFDESVLILPPSLQLIKPDEHGFSYKGADYLAYQTISKDIDCKIKQYALKIGTILKNAGYRGICGVDFLIERDNIFLMEINARFQSSTFLINYALKEYGAPYSMHLLHLQACSHLGSPVLSNEFSVPLSFFHYSNDTRYITQLQHNHSLLQDIDGVRCVDDFLDWSYKLKPFTYLYKAVFHRPISAVSPEYRCRLHVNIGLCPMGYSATDLRYDMEKLKILLLSHGTRLSLPAEHQLKNNGGFNHEEFDALDLVLAGHIYACVPFESNLSQLSPFCVDMDTNGALVLTYYEQKIIPVSVRHPDAVGTKRTSRGVYYHDITYLTNDRLRIYQRPGCYFKDCNLGCKFCDVPKNAEPFSIEDILQTIDEYRSHPHVRHYLIGGGSTAPSDSFQTAITIANHITKTTHKPIYLMSLPPRNLEYLDMLKNAGVSEVAFNLELYDRNLAKQYMPGKGEIPLSVYDDAFRYATKLWGKTGNVRTIFVVGLETVKSLLDGVEHVAQMGVAPILSLFRPLPETPLRDFLAPEDDEIWYIYQQAKLICQQYGLELGPACRYCEDNILKVTLR